MIKVKATVQCLSVGIWGQKTVKQGYAVFGAKTKTKKRIKKERKGNIKDEEKENDKTYDNERRSGRIDDGLQEQRASRAYT